MATRGGVSLDEYRTEVEAMLAAGRPIAVIERMLERAPLDAEQRSSLWLLAWGLRNPADQAESQPRRFRLH